LPRRWRSLPRRLRLDIGSAEWAALITGAEGAAEAIMDLQKHAFIKDLIGAVLEVIEDGTTIDAFRADYERSWPSTVGATRATAAGTAG
jgi:hypothetical protein